MKRKDSTVELKLHPTLTNFLFDVDELYRTWGSEITITSGSEPTAKHSYTSLHYANPAQAVDTRIWVSKTNTIPPPTAQREAIQKVAEHYCEDKGIPTDWIEIILEGNHIHIEYQPKRPKTFT